MMGKHEMQLKKAVDAVNNAYRSEDYDRYEALLDRESKRFNYTRNQFEDIVTDTRLFGWDIG